ncbi:endonuclease/exonuclease/phosphatase family protein [Nocardia cyriacigeorgica]|uniref:Exodeoxyribonuclease III n=1 Tax=Nocardia cyriacigeorgica TaxID=135487 RepID=A0A4U8VVJ8_9NOCA|nr:endonuclease/exonuclease/phosphatase family protein [Nocardia cyriacigeorgica]VFA96359.1 exodeoxyribonuclease III [Nocardia cyriacigeorgica]
MADGCAQLSCGQILEQWLLRRGDQVLVLTEMKNSDGGRELLACLRAEGYTITTANRSSSDDPYFAVIATRGLTTTAVPDSRVGPRIAALDIHITGGTLRTVGMYAPTNGMSAESSHRRSIFQQHAIGYLTSIATPAMLVTGDLNIIEPGHQPRLPAFEAHDYRFYSDLIALGLRDAFRVIHPDTVEHSWFSERYGNQRIDHTFVSADDTRALTMCVYDHSTRTTGISDHAAMVTVLGYATAQPTEAGASR